MQPFDREFGIEAAGFRQGGPRLFLLAFERIDRGEIGVWLEGAKTKINRLMLGFDGRFEMAEIEFRVAQPQVPAAYEWIARTQPYRLQRVGFRLFVLAEGGFGAASYRVQRGVIRINREFGVRGAERFIPTPRDEEVKAFT